MKWTGFIPLGLSEHWNIVHQLNKHKPMKELTITPPAGFEISEVAIKDGIAVAVLKEKVKKDLEYYWNKYKNWRETTATVETDGWYVRSFPYMMSEDWCILIDFYRWLAEELNRENTHTKGIFEIYYKNVAGVFQINWSMAITSIPIPHTSEASAKAAIEILGEDLLKKIFRV